MGNGDRRRSMKMRRRKGQAAKKARIKRHRTAATAKSTPPRSTRAKKPAAQ